MPKGSGKIPKDSGKMPEGSGKIPEDSGNIAEVYLEAMRNTLGQEPSRT